ncbi:ChrR family anti-sigma-E factor [Pokkaliibacter sp. CJK22405]|uniref:ChrR family anti-sigma-E factor n=1 Tax=Pokkaliibacter sp. CJK22405 TaxID=3384615 RepID=UPI0039847D04
MSTQAPHLMMNSRMTTPVHHPDDATLISYAAGALSLPLSITLSCHLAVCPQCRERLKQAQAVGGALLERCDEIQLSSNARSNMLAALDDDSLDQAPVTAAEPKLQDLDDTGINDHAREDLIPAPLRPWLGERYSELRWSTLAPGMKQVKITLPQGNLRLFRITPGTCMPHHGHGGSEMTLVLKGSYSDEVGRFQPGDIADLDPDIEHQPIADRDQDCICLIATDAPLKFSGFVPRLLQPFFGL